MLCGDEINAIVVDIGAKNSRFGFAGQDSPRHIIDSNVGIIKGEDQNLKRYWGESSLKMIHPELEIRPALQDQDQRAGDLESLLSYGVENLMSSKISENAMMIPQGSFFRELNEQKELMELCFETFHAPAYFSLPSSFLSSISHGRSSSIVLDLGHLTCSIAPVIDGFELKKARIVPSYNGKVLEEEVINYFNQRANISQKMDIDQSSYSKDDLDLDTLYSNSNLQFFTPKISQLLKLQTNSYAQLLECNNNSSRFISYDSNPFHRYITSSAYKYYLDDFLLERVKKHFFFVPSVSIHQSYRSNIGLRKINLIIPQELPISEDQTLYPDYDLCSIPERKFFNEDYYYNLITNKRQGSSTIENFSQDLITYNRKRARELVETEHNQRNQKDLSPSGNPIELSDSLAHLLYLSLSRVDHDAHKELLNNLIVVGGCSNIPGLTLRLLKEISDILPSHYKVKCPSLSLSPFERQHAAWIGGSILSICGAFQQTWISRNDYEEQGAERLYHDKFIY